MCVGVLRKMVGYVVCGFGICRLEVAGMGVGREGRMVGGVLWGAGGFVWGGELVYGEV